MSVRLNKFLSECGIASRRKVEELIVTGRVAVNNRIVKTLSLTINPLKDHVTLDGEKIARVIKVYYLLNKPRATVSTTSDEKNRKTVVDLINTQHKIFPVGRLDYNTTGVLLLTNDGDLNNLLTHPSNNVPREYIADLDKPLSEKDKIRLLNGIRLDRKKSKFQNISFPRRNNFKQIQVVTAEGRNHFVKNMFIAIGYDVKKLKRTRFGEITTGKLSEGNYRKLSVEEIDKIFKKYSNKSVG